MDFKQLYKDIIGLNYGSFSARWRKLKTMPTIVKHALIFGLGINLENTKKIKKIPIIINNRNRYTYLLQVISWLEKNGYANIYIIDNASTYPPLLDYYSATKYKVFRLKENIGHLALWQTGIIKQFVNNYYIYTDPDILPIEECPGNVMEVFMQILKKHEEIEKVGFGLKIDDLPDYYAHKKKVLDWEVQFWEKPIEKDLYDAHIDTTFALYRPFTDKGPAIKSYRTGGEYMARHLPWYEDSKNPTEENIYYKNHIKKGASHWINAESEPDN